MGRQHQPQPIIVVIVVRIVVVAVRRGGIILIVVERTAPQHLPGSLTDLSQQRDYKRKNRQNRLR